LDQDTSYNWHRPRTHKVDLDQDTSYNWHRPRTHTHQSQQGITRCSPSYTNTGTWYRGKGSHILRGALGVSRTSAPDESVTDLVVDVH